MNLSSYGNFSGYGVGDWAQLAGNVITAAGAGYLQGGRSGAVYAAVLTLVTLLQTPPGHIRLPK
jgi:hypothetical protein